MNLNTEDYMEKRSYTYSSWKNKCRVNARLDVKPAFRGHGNCRVCGSLIQRNEVRLRIVTHGATILVCPSCLNKNGLVLLNQLKEV